MNTESMVREQLARVGIEVNGNKPWDPQIHDARVYNMLLTRGTEGAGTAYMHGLWDCADLPGFFERCLVGNFDETLPKSIANVVGYLKGRLFDRFSERNALEEGKIHYDLPEEMWEATLDKRMTGSCAYYRTDSDSLDKAQEQKIDLVLQKSAVPFGGTTLDIGIGWASVSGRAVEKYDVRPIGYTVSQEQANHIRRRYGDRIDVRVEDFRRISLDAPVDAVVSLEMFEHVGRPYWRTFFEITRASLKPGGTLVLHTIIRHDPKDEIDAWQQKYIYTNGCLPTPGQVCTAAHGLFHLEDVHDIGAHYPRTLQSWMDNFRSARAELKKLGPARFGGMDPEVACRMWEYHYDQCNAGFRTRAISVQQFVFTTDGVRGGVPTYR